MRLSACAATLLLALGCRAPADGPAVMTPQTAVRPGVQDGYVPSADGVPIHYHEEGVVDLHAAALQFVDQVGLDRFVLVGHSMSGQVILEAARLLPDRVIALIPVDTLNDVTWKPGKEIDDLLESMRRDFPGATREFVKGMFPPGADPDLVERIASRISRAPPEIAVAVLRAVFSFDSAAAMARVRQPIRAINAATYPTQVEINRRYAPQFGAVIIQGTGHFPMLEKPEEFNRLLADAVADLAPARP